MAPFLIKDNSVDAKPDYSINPQELEFGKKFAANMFTCRYANGAWEEGEIAPFSELTLHPAAIVFHYGQAIFEGLKAYKAPGGGAFLFRPELNAKRLNKSALRLDMPEFPVEHFLEAVKRVVLTNKNFIPEHPGNLYLRPTMIATEPCIGVRGAKELLFYIIALPTGSYFKNAPGNAGSIEVLVAQEVSRASRGGLGSAKAAANYAVSLRSIREAKDLGCAQALFLDSADPDQIEEMGGMNIVFVSGKTLLTPRLTDTILPGITRQSIIEIAPSLGLEVEERKLSLSETLAGIKEGRIQEAIACGTAAVVTGIRSFRLSSSGETISLGAAPGPVTERLYAALTGIQFGKSSDTLGWITRI